VSKTDPHNPFSDSEDDGVVYETTRNTIQHGYRRTLEPTPAKKEKEKEKDGKSHFAYFYIITLFSGVVICMVIFAIVFNTYTSSRKDDAKPNASSQPNVTEVGVTEVRPIVGVIKSVDIATESIILIDAVSSAETLIPVRSSTEMKSKYGDPITFKDFAAGDIVDAGMDSSNRLISLAKSSSAFNLPMRTKVAIDLESRTIETNSDVYRYNEKILVLNKGQPYDISQLLPIDVVTLSGIGDTVSVINLNKGHGYVRIGNLEFIDNGVVEIDTDIYSSLEELFEAIPLVEGQHRIVVKGDNIEPYIKDLEITPNAMTFVDLEDIQVKTGILNLSVNVQNYTLILDGNPHLASEPPLLPYGVHMVRVEKDGYIPVEQVIDVMGPSTDLSIQLKEVLKLGRVTITAVPSGANVFIDSALIGQAPVSISLELGTHDVKLTMDGYKELVFSINVVSGSGPDNSYNATLERVANTPAPQPTPIPFHQVKPGEGVILTPPPSF
jgi:hypothetical protein